ncbi:MAG TPA: alpha/beta hydrolase [Caulobacteraceae bacterium]|jgi:pimeloyl-ACP methyl ester carboxylesterase|nr:alpha/beta hydrolase [Caulobacteraceae bacterium]
MDAPGEMIDIGGRRLHLLRRGAGGPTVVLEAGGGGGSSTQDWPLLGRIGRFTHALSYDRAGLGWSDPSPAPKTFDGMADDLDALLASAGESPPFVLVGGSFGGLVAQAYCRRYPAKVAGAVFLDAPDAAKYFPTMRQRLAFHEADLRREADRAERGEVLAEAEPAISAARGLDDVTKAAMRHVLGLRSHYEAALDELQAAVRATPEEMASAEPGSLGERPLVVLSAGKSAQDPAWQQGWPEAQARLTALSRRGVHLVAELTGHSLALENPRLVSAAAEAVVRAARGEPFDITEVRRLAAGG